MEHTQIWHFSFFVPANPTYISAWKAYAILLNLLLIVYFKSSSLAEHIGTSNITKGWNNSLTNICKKQNRDFYLISTNRKHTPLSSHGAIFTRQNNMQNERCVKHHCNNHMLVFPFFQLAQILYLLKGIEYKKGSSFRKATAIKWKTWWFITKVLPPGNKWTSLGCGENPFTWTEATPI
jgi:hypothetical protein